MTRFELADRRIEEKELALARAQHDLTPTLIEANLMREALDEVLTTASVMARASIVVLDRIGDSFEESVERMQRDLNGRD